MARVRQEQRQVPSLSTSIFNHLPIFTPAKRYSPTLGKCNTMRLFGVAGSCTLFRLLEGFRCCMAGRQTKTKSQTLKSDSRVSVRLHETTFPNISLALTNTHYHCTGAHERAQNRVPGTYYL